MRRILFRCGVRSPGQSFARRSLHAGRLPGATPEFSPLWRGRPAPVSRLLPHHRAGRKTGCIHRTPSTNGNLQEHAFSGYADHTCRRAESKSAKCKSRRTSPFAQLEGWCWPDRFHRRPTSRIPRRGGPDRSSWRPNELAGPPPIRWLPWLLAFGDGSMRSPPGENTLVMPNLVFTLVLVCSVWKRSLRNQGIANFEEACRRTAQV